MNPKKYFTEEEKREANRISKRKSYLKNKEKINNKKKIYYELHKNELYEKSKIYNKEWKKLNKERVNKQKRDRDNNNRNDVNRKAREFWSKNRNRLIEKQKIWYLQNKKSELRRRIIYYSNNKDKLLQKNKEYRKENPFYNRLQKIKRRDRKRSILEKYSKQLIENTFIKFNNCCFNCKSKDKLAIDHHYPLSKGFALTINNAVLLCKSCNSKKAAKLPEYFYSPEQLTDLQLNYGISKSPLKEEQPSLFEARMPKNLERDNGILEAMNAA